MKYFFVLLFISSIAQAQTITTKFEQSKGTQTPTYFEITDWWKKLDEKSGKVKMLTMGMTDAGYPLHLIVVTNNGDHNFDNIRKNNKRVILVNNGIHPGEPDGIDASMLLARDIVSNKIKLPDNIALAIIPVYNIGGCLNRSNKYRVDQNGPEEFGSRGNSQNLDLNRDFIKCDSKEARAFAEIFHLTDPDVFVDNHVSNGADYQHIMTLICTQHNKLGGIIGAQVFAIVGDMFSYERRGRAMGIVMGGFAAASILGVPLSLYVTNLFKHNWHLPFLMIGGVALLLLPLIIKVIPNMKGHIKEKDEDDSLFTALVTVAKIPIQRAALAFSGLLMMGHFLIIPFINPYLEFNKGFSRNDIPSIYLVGGMASLLAAISLGKIADKKGKLNIFSLSVFFSLFMVLIITRLPNVHFMVVLIFFALWFMVATGRIVTAQAMITEVVKPEQRGSFMSINGSIQQLGSGLAALCAGAIVTKERTGRILHYEWVGYLSIVVLLLSLLFGRLIFRKIDNPVADREEIIKKDLVQEST